MPLRQTSHRHARMALGVLNLLVIGAVYTLLLFGTRDVPVVLAFVIFGVLVGGGYLAQLAFSHWYPAVCSACGAASALPTWKHGSVYVCRKCGAEISLQYAIHVEQLALGGTLADHERKIESRWGWGFVAVGAGCVTAGIWLAQDAIGLLRVGISTEAKVVRVTAKAARDNKGKSQTIYTAHIRYHVDGIPRTLERGWSVGEGGFCAWPCYRDGQQLKVIYHPGDPKRAKVHALDELLMAPGIVSSVGLVFALVGYVIVRQRRPRPRRPK